MPFEHGHAHIQIVRSQMGIAHGHRKRLMAEPHLNPSEVDAAPHEPGGAGMS